MELRAKLLRLRQKAAEVLCDKPALLRLMIDSVSNFLVLARHALLVSGLPCRMAASAKSSRHLAAIGVDADALRYAARLARAEASKPATWIREALFARYLKQIEALVAHVDRLEK